MAACMRAVQGGGGARGRRAAKAARGEAAGVEQAARARPCLVPAGPGCARTPLYLQDCSVFTVRLHMCSELHTLNNASY